MPDSIIHPTAIVDPDAKLGVGVRVDAYAIIEKDTVIGDYSHISYHAVIYGGARIGAHCTIHTGASISNIPQDLKFAGEYTQTHIGAHTTIREYVTIHRGTKAEGQTKIGEHCLIMCYSHVAHDCVVGDHCVLSNSLGMAGHVNIGNHVVVGGMVAIHQFTKIGDYVMVGGCSALVQDLPPYVLVGRREDMKSCFTSVNVIGLRRKGIAPQVINHIKQIYNIFYDRGLNRPEAIAKIKESISDTVEKKTILDFIENSQRGIIS